MKLMEQFTERLNLYISPGTFEVIEQAAFKDGRKTGSFVRIILDQWVKEKNEQENKL